MESTSQVKSPAKNSVNRRGRTLVSQNVEKKTAAGNSCRVNLPPRSLLFRLVLSSLSCWIQIIACNISMNNFLCLTK